ncbi:zinc ABC transporter substrate-binding protein [soil metagenome]
MSRTRSASRFSARLVVVAVAVAAGSATILSGCATGPGTGSAGSGAVGAPIAIVASTDVYGDIASHIGGSAVSVTSIITDPSKDPHEYTADAQNQLALSRAAIVVENGGGYDDFVDTMLSSAKNPGVTVLNVASISGYDQQPASGAFNEHLWYDFATVSKVADQLATRLGSIDPANASTFSANAVAFQREIASLEATEAQLKAAHAGTEVAITEPVPLYLLTALGLVNVTPEKFSAAVESGTDAAPDVLAQTESLFTSGQVKLLVYNSQASGPQTDAVLAAATSAGAATVAATETLPRGSGYVQWMTDNLAALSSALSEQSAR